MHATLAARTRSSGASSPVLTITTQRFSPSAPRLVLEELLHLAAALADQGDRPRYRRWCAWRCCDISVLLPTPGPEKMPMRWPRPQVCRPSIARMLVAIGWRMLSRSSGATPRPSIRRDSLERQRALAVDRLAEAVEHPAEQLLASTRCAAAAEMFSIRSPRATPAVLDSGISSVRSCWKPITSAVRDAAAEAVNAAQRAERQREVAGFDGQPADRLHRADDAQTASQFRRRRVGREERHFVYSDAIASFERAVIWRICG